MLVYLVTVSALAMWLRSPSTAGSALDAIHRDGGLFHQINAEYPKLALAATDPHVFVVEDFLSAAESAALIEKLDDAEVHPSSDKLNSVGERTSTSAVLQNEEVAGLRKRLAALANVSLTQMQPLKLTRYEAGGVFMRHTDCTVALSSSAEDALDPRRYPNRFCTVLLCMCIQRHAHICGTLTWLTFRAPDRVFADLNSCEEGGRTCFRWMDSEPGFYARQRTRMSCTALGMPLQLVSWLEELAALPWRLAPSLSMSGGRQGRELCITPKQGMAVIHFPCTAAHAGLVPDYNADHESEPAADVKYVCQQFIWSTPMDSPDVDAQLRAKWDYFEGQQPAAPLSTQML